jgi:hypothetical protein
MQQSLIKLLAGIEVNKEKDQRRSQVSYHYPPT